jgi:Transglutaminase-like superfamily
VTVWGAGPVGLFAIQSAKVLGATPSRQASRGWQLSVIARPPDWEASWRSGASRYFAHLVIALCRCRDVPARYCTGYLEHIGGRLIRIL